MEVERNNQASQERSITIPKLILASASPRRAEILRSVGWPFETLPAHIDEPSDEDDANRMLRVLNGRSHQVLTGVALVNDVTGQSKVAHEVTDVRFAEMSDEEINWYVATGEPMDKAGAYAIQGHGALFIKEIRGDYFNVVGLPVRLLYRLIGG